MNSKNVMGHMSGNLANATVINTRKQQCISSIGARRHFRRGEGSKSKKNRPQEQKMPL